MPTTVEKIEGRKVFFPSRVGRGLDAAIVILILVTIGWTVLALGGVRPQTMILPSLLVPLAAALGLLRLGWAHRIRRLSIAALFPLPFLLYALWSAQTVAPATWLGMREVGLWWQGWLIFVLALLVPGSGRHRSVLVAGVLATGLIAVGMAWYQTLGDGEWLMLGRRQAPQYAGRAGGSFGSPNSFAGLLLLLIMPALAMACAREVRPGWRWGAGVVALIFLSGIVLSGSRGAWISLIVVLIAAASLWFRGARAKAVAVGAVVLAVGVGGWVLYHQSESLRNRVLALVHDKGEQSRPVMWQAAWMIFRQYPVFGGGAGSYNIYFDRHRPEDFQAEPVWAHNEYLNTLCEFGAVGAGVALAGLAGFAWLAWLQRRRRRDPFRGAQSGGEEAYVPGLFLGLAGFLLHAGVDFHFRIPGLVFVAALWAGLVFRRSPGPRVTLRLSGRRGLAALLAVLTFATASLAAVPAYRGEARRLAARERIDRISRSFEAFKENPSGVQEILADLERAAAMDPSNGQTWSDWAYALHLRAHLEPELRRPLGVEAQAKAERALALSSELWEFWVRQGVSLDMQGKWEAASPSFVRALLLNRNGVHPWYYQAYHLSLNSAQRPRAVAAIRLVLRLDANHHAAIILAEQMNGRQSP